MHLALYIFRCDGDYDFAAAFSPDQLLPYSDGMIASLEQSGDSVVAIEFPDPSFPDVLDHRFLSDLKHRIRYQTPTLKPL
jgi:hypothetical protein